MDLNHRPLGYEKRSHHLSAEESVAPKGKISCQIRFRQLKCNRFWDVRTTKVCQLIRSRDGCNRSRTAYSLVVGKRSSTKCFLLLSVRIPTLRQSGNYAQQIHSNSQLTDCFVSLALRRAAHDCITGDSGGASVRAQASQKARKGCRYHARN